ncbi:hypothetical protein NLJ89_g8047 [Agrocybe chaxingu]|uniref:DNA polymerase delta subunit 3 n=1 Tax=Agrocybe chaxingu TaxID=84603 RepID=A0A9W8MT38_9AGAR|nr:hypothetical protein NLJ89_g8047 [Agrocybe chaxingu]
MSTPAISDYLTKQLSIERNVVTYRSLSRQFSIHVNTAKNELATYHHEAPYKSLRSAATFIISGTPRRSSSYKYGDEDYDMDAANNIEEEYDDSEDVEQTHITIVNERDLEGAKATYDEIQSIHVYSLSPAPLHDAGFICTPTEFIRKTDVAKGSEYAAVVGRIVGKGIKLGASKRGPGRTASRGLVAGPSKLKKPLLPTKPPSRSEPTAPAPAPAEKPQEKPKPSGKLNFFKKAKEPVVEVKKEESTADMKKKMFFSKPVTKELAKKEPAVKAPSRAPSIASVKAEREEPSIPPKEQAPAPRGIKRKSSVGLESRERTPENPAITKTDGGARVKGRVVLSDDDESDAPVKPPRRKGKATYRSASIDHSEAERAAIAMMEIDDDLVERASHAPSTVISSEDPDDTEESMQQDEDVDMAEPDEPVVKPKTKRKPKAVIPVGKNGLKKRKVTKTRKTLDANGYMVTEDYSDWESVDADAEPEPPVPKPKTKKSVAVKKEDENTDIPPAKEKPKEKEPAPVKKIATKPAPATKSKPAAKVAGGKQQKLNFFGPTKKT